MPTARAVAGEATAELMVAVYLGSRDPLDTLVDRVRPLAARSVDALEIAAALEATGVTDRVARVWFGFTDVFELAEEVRRRAAPAADLSDKPAQRPRTAPWRDVSHGVIYLMPAAIFPAAVSGLGGRVAFVMAIVLTAAVGWVYSGVIAWRAYHLIGEARPHSAQRLLFWAALCAVPLGAAVAGAVVAVTGVNPLVVLLAAGAMAYQMAVTILVIHRGEALVLAAVAPALVAGVAYLIAGGNLRQLALAAGVASVGCLFGLALRETLVRRTPAEPSGSPIRSDRRELLMVFAYTALSAAFFLYPQVAHLTTQFDVVLAVLPVIAGMGVVEWRSHRFAEDARELLSRVAHPRQFAARIWLVLLYGLCTCFGVVGLLAVALLGVLAATGRYTEASAFMAAAGVLLAGAYFLGFLLANLGRYRVLCVNLVLGLAAYELASIALPGVLGDTYAFRIAAATLLVLNLVGLIGVLGHARRHR
jgi:hypothetical protein